MKHQETLVFGGVDAHADSHHAAALDERVLERDSLKIAPSGAAGSIATTR